MGGDAPTVPKRKKKAKTWIPTSSSPRQSLSRGPWFLKTKEKAKTWIPD